MPTSALLGESVQMVRVRELVALYGHHARSVTLIGPTGVGKGLVAQCLHQLGGLQGALVAVPGGTLTDTLCHTQLFGHERGAFTDAKARVRGAFELASAGTLFIDEIPHWTKAAQSALLRPLSEGVFRPVGAERELQVTCRMVFASTRGLDALVGEGALLEDLRWRIPRFEIEIPGLAERRSDILLLASAFLTGECRRLGVRTLEFAPEVIAALLGYRWPGNVRELQGEISVAAVHAVARQRERLDLRDLSPAVAQAGVRVGELDDAFYLSMLAVRPMGPSWDQSIFASSRAVSQDTP